MDFVIVGIVIGSVLVGAGALLRDLGPRLRPRLNRPDAAALEPDHAVLSWTRCCQAFAMAVTILGFLTVVATVVAFLMNAGDAVGWLVVAAGALLAISGSVVSAVAISRHYRRGGFDPVAWGALPAWAGPVASTTSIGADQSVPIEPDDPFEIAAQTPVVVAREPIADDVLEAEPIIAEPTLHPFDPAPEVSELEEPPSAGIEAPPLQPDAPVLERDSAFDAAGREQEWPLSFEHEPAVIEAKDEAITWTLPETEPVTQRWPELDLEPEAERWSEPDLKPMADRWPEPGGEAWDEPILAPVEPPLDVPVLSAIDPPLIDPDDELPAWGAPPIERSAPAPVQHVPSSEVGAAFESSLLADLGPESAPARETSGPFQSRLLNELTAPAGEPEPSGDDVLIAESPAAQGRRTSDDSRQRTDVQDASAHRRQPKSDV